MLTQKQKDLLLFIHKRMSAGEIAPSFEEMKEFLGLKSKSGIHRLITALVERGYLERLPHRARAIHIKKLPPGYSIGYAPHSQTISSASSSKFSAEHHPASLQSTGTDKPYEHAAHNLASDLLGERADRDSAAQDGRAGFPSPSSLPYPANAVRSNQFAAIPLHGKIAAGTPIEAIRHDIDQIEVPNSMIGNGEYYALTVEGNSMINAGIHDNDLVLIRRCENCNDGDIVVALVDDQEATLKRLYRRGQQVVLEPENENYKRQEFSADRVRVQGVLTSLIRHYR